MQKKQESQSFYVRVKEPEELKRLLLEALKDTVQVLRGIEQLKHARKDILQQTEKLKADVREISKLNGKLKVALPASNLRVEPEKKAVVNKVHKKKHDKKSGKKEEKNAAVRKEVKAQQPRPEPPRKLSELEKLESELGMIEDRLRGLK